MDVKSISKIFQKHFGRKFSRYSLKSMNEIIVMNKNLSNNFYNSPFSVKERAISKIVTSGNIRYGDFIEDIIRCFLEENMKTIKLSDKRKFYDFIFQIDKKLYVGEIKMRDNHDSTKKIGQIKNLITKCFNEKKQSKNYYVTAILFFVDPNLIKNCKYYVSELDKAKKNKKIDDYDVLYGDDFFKKFKLEKKWNQLKQLVLRHNNKLINQNSIFKMIKKYINEKQKYKEIVDLIDQFS